MNVVVKELESFKKREIRARSIFYIKEVDKHTCYEFVKMFHYLGTAKFFCVHGYGLYYMSEDGDVCVGVATYSNPQGASALKGRFNLPNTDQTVLELSRLCL